MATVDEQELDQFNQQLRADPQYQAFLQSLGVVTDVPEFQAWKLNDQQRKLAQQWVAERYGMPDAGRGMEIDSSGNANQNEGFGKYAKDWKTYAAIGAGLTGAGALGVGPLAGVFGGGSAAAGGGAAATGAATGGASTGGVLAASAIPAALAMQAVPGIGSAATSAATGGMWAKLGGLLGGNASGILEAGGSALGAAADSSAQNRGARLEAAAVAEQLNQARQRNYFESAALREADRRAGGADAMRALQQAEYIQNAEGYTPKNGLASYGFGPKASTQAEREGAAKFSAEARRRLDAGDSLLPALVNPGEFKFNEEDLNAGGFESFANVASPIMTGVGGLASMNARQRTMAEALRQYGLTPTAEDLERLK